MFDHKMHEELEKMSREDLIVYARELSLQLSDEDIQAVIVQLGIGTPGAR